MPKLTMGQARLSYVRRQTVPELRCYCSECSVAKRTLYTTDDQCSSVSRTQSSDASVGDESAVVSQVAWDMAGLTPRNKRDDLAADTLEAFQCSWRSTGEMWSDRRVPVISLAAAFCTDCRRYVNSSVMP